MNNPLLPDSVMNVRLVNCVIQSFCCSRLLYSVSMIGCSFSSGAPSVAPLVAPSVAPSVAPLVDGPRLEFETNCLTVKDCHGQYSLQSPRTWIEASLINLINSDFLIPCLLDSIVHRLPDLTGVIYEIYLAEVSPPFITSLLAHRSRFEQASIMVMVNGSFLRPDDYPRWFLFRHFSGIANYLKPYYQQFNYSIRVREMGYPFHCLMTYLLAAMTEYDHHFTRSSEMVLYRGVRIPDPLTFVRSAASSAALPQITERQWEEPSFMSTSLSRDIALNRFIGSSNGLLLRCLLPPTSASGQSYPLILPLCYLTPAVEEILIAPGTRWTMGETTPLVTAGGNTIIEVTLHYEGQSFDQSTITINPRLEEYADHHASSFSDEYYHLLAPSSASSLSPLSPSSLSPSSPSSPLSPSSPSSPLSPSSLSPSSPSSPSESSKDRELFEAIIDGRYDQYRDHALHSLHRILFRGITPYSFSRVVRLIHERSEHLSIIQLRRIDNFLDYDWYRRVYTGLTYRVDAMTLPSYRQYPVTGRPYVIITGALLTFSHLDLAEGDALTVTFHRCVIEIVKWRLSYDLATIIFDDCTIRSLGNLSSRYPLVTVTIR